jgi:hypothetical protein
MPGQPLRVPKPRNCQTEIPVELQKPKADKALTLVKLELECVQSSAAFG